MVLEVKTIGGYSECGRNCTAIRVDDEVILLDIGLEMENYVKYQQTDRDNLQRVTYDELLEVNAVPNVHLLDEWKSMVKAIVPSHGHLDHIGAIPFTAPLFPNAPIISTPYTIQVIKSILRDERIRLHNRLIAQNSNTTYKLSDKIKIEFVHVTHSIPHTATVVIHTPYGRIVYANDYKFDLNPLLGKKPNFARLKELGEEGVDLLLSECLYAHVPMRSPSEAIAKQMLKDVLNGTDVEGKAIVCTTFASHIARIKILIELAEKMGRKVVLFGRSLGKYIDAAERIKLVNFSKKVDIVTRRKAIEQYMRKINKVGADKYFIICTGHQGEPRAILSRIANGELPLNLKQDDMVLFSASVIPVEVSIANRAALEANLHKKGIRFFTDLHVSGHGHREDYREMLQIVKPKHIIPCHAGPSFAANFSDLAQQLGYKEGENIHIMENGKSFKLQ